jgi:CRP-like cAMP-binding protein
LRAVPLWAGVPETRLIEVAHGLHGQGISQGTEVVRQGEPGDRFYVIASGSFEVLVDGEPVAQLARGDYFGERALLNGALRAATVLATTPGRVFWMDQAAFRATLAHDLAFRARVEAHMEYRASVAAMPLFRDLAPIELDALLARMHIVPAQPGEVIVRQGEVGDRFYVIHTGRAEVERDGQIIAELGPGEAFGEIALLLDVPRTATVRTLEATELLALDARDFHDLLAGYCNRGVDLQQLSSKRLEQHRRLLEVAA